MGRRHKHKHKHKHAHVIAAKSKQPPTDGWDLYTRYERCPDCDLRDALSITGKPRHDFDPHHRRMRRSGLGWLLRVSPRVVDDCEGCGGTGRVRRQREGDPMRGAQV